MIRRRGAGRGKRSAQMASRSTGHGPTIVMCHGVAIGPDSFDRMVDLLAGDHRVVAAVRPGYDGTDGGSRELEGQVASLKALLAAQPSPGLLVGVDGGATLGLALAIESVEDPELAGWHFLLHEPLVGPACHELHRSAVDAIEHLRNPTSEGVLAFASSLARGPVEALGADPGTIAADARAFTAFAPSREALATLPADRVTSALGDDQPPSRRAAADLLAELARIPIEVVTGAAHEPQLQSPEAFAQLVRSTVPA